METDHDALRMEIAKLTEQYREREIELEHARTDLRIAASTIKVQEAEIRLLTDVLARDRTRVQAETALSAQQIAAATTPTKRDQ